MTRKPTAMMVSAALAVLVILVFLLRPNDSDAITTLRAGTPHQIVTLTIGSTRMGDTGLTIELAGHDGIPVAGAFIRVVTVMPLMGYATPEKVATAAEDGRYTVTGVHLMTTGPWQIHLLVILPGGTRDELVMPFHVTG